MPWHFWWLGWRSLLRVCTASFLGFLLPSAIVAIPVGICYFGIIGVLPLWGSFFGPVCLTTIYQPLWLFSHLHLFLPLWHACRFHKAFTLALPSGESCALSCPTRLCDTSISEHQKNLFSHSGMTTLKNIYIYFFFNNSLVWQNSPLDYFESLDLVLALYSEQFTGHC